jgi:zinc and cadmium transporter
MADLTVLTWILLMTFLDGIVALIGVFSLWLKDRILRKIIMVLVAFSAGALLSGGLFHLLAESLEHLTTTVSFSLLLLGFILFFLIERFLKWHHCHEEKCKIHPFSYLILFGDGIHNFIDGLIIAASFLVNINFGIVTTLLIIGHEAPQELGDFGVLVYGGFSKVKALTFNFISQLTCMIGGVLGFFILTLDQVLFLLPFAAGGFFYIAASDLIPELHKEINLKKSIESFIFFLVGIAFMLTIKIIFKG